MSARHPTIGGKGKAVTDKPPRQRKPRAAPALIPCDNCGRRNQVMLLPGDNDVTIICDCGADLTISVRHDGFGNAVILSGRIEIWVKDE